MRDVADNQTNVEEVLQALNAGWYEALNTQQPTVVAAHYYD